MEFNQSEDRRMLGETLNRFILDKYDMESRHGYAASDKGYSEEIWSELAELGIIGALFTEDDGGFGGAGFDIAVVFEAIGRGLLIEPFLESAVLAGGAIAAAGNADQRAALEGIIMGTTVAALAHSEAAGRYTIAHVSATATAAGDGWTLNGAKAVVKHGDAADLFVVSARTAGDIADTDGISLFLVPAATSGVDVRGYKTVDSGRAAEVTFSDVSLDAAALLGDAGAAHGTLELVIGRGIVALAAEALGAMEVAKDMTLEYLQARKQFGLPIGKFQALQHRMAEMLMEIEQMRSSVINAAAAVDDSDRITRERALSAAKYTASRTGCLIAEEAIQMHGGMGMTWELPLGHYSKRLIMIDHELGDEDYHLARFIALGKA